MIENERGRKEVFPDSKLTRLLGIELCDLSLARSSNYHLGNVCLYSEAVSCPRGIVYELDLYTVSLLCTDCERPVSAIVVSQWIVGYD